MPGLRAGWTIERQAGLRAAQASRPESFSSERVFEQDATPELVSQDRKRPVGSPDLTDQLRTPADPSLGAVGAGSNAGPHFCLGEAPTLPLLERGGCAV
jgi:hypothetical protein